MKKRLIGILMVLTFILIIPAYAQTARMIDISPSLTFDDETATCSVFISGDRSSDEISATIKLKHGSREITSWNESASGFLVFEDTVQVDKNRTYILEVTATINGETLPTATISRTCS